MTSAKLTLPMLRLCDSVIAHLPSSLLIALSDGSGEPYEIASCIAHNEPACWIEPLKKPLREAFCNLNRRHGGVALDLEEP